jgi:diaminobutyrate-2-oxoglutarate transaminase
MRLESNARTYPLHLPLVPVEGRGAQLRDASGRWFYDCLAAAGAAALGWNHPVINEAIQSVLASGAPLLTLDFPTPLRDAFFDELLRSLPPELSADAVVHLCGPSGANAVEAALTAAEIATGGDEHIAMEGAFHGCSRGARGVSTGGGLRRAGNVLQKSAHFLPFPQEYRCPFGVGGAESVRLASCMAENLLFGPHSALTKPASIIVECVQGEAGSLPAPAAWLRSLRGYADRRGIPLIADEIQAGVCRTGKTWSFEHSGIVPDIMVASKGLGAGIPIAVIVMRRSVNVWKPGAFTGTFRGNSMAFATAAATLRFARENNLAQQAALLGEQLLGALRRVQAASTCIGEVRGRGLMAGVDVVDPDAPADRRGTRPPAARLARRLQRACFEEGLIVEVGGAYENVIRFLPPLIVTAAEVDIIADLFARAVHKIEGAPR